MAPVLAQEAAPETTTPAPSVPSTPSAPAAPASPSTGDTQVLVAEVLVEGTEDETLINRVYGAIQTRAGEPTTRATLQNDINAVFATGFFADVRAVPTDTPLGVRVTFNVKPNPVLQTVETEGSQVLPDTELDRIFAEQKGQVINFGDLQRSVQEVETWYADNGYVLAKVTDVRSDDSGVVTLQIAEGVIEDVRVKFLSESGSETDEQGNPIRGNTRDFIITRELSTQPGDTFNRDQVQSDLQAVFGLNLFQDVNLSLDPGQDPEKVIVVVNVKERRTGSLNGTVGVSSSSGVFGSIGISESNLGGNNQTINASVQVGARETLFDLSFTDPRIATEEIPTAYNVSIFNRRSASFVFDEEFGLPNGDSVRINRVGTAVTFSRPIGDGWQASLGAQLQFVDARDADNNTYTHDILGNPIVFNESGQDAYTTLRLGLVNDTRDNAITPRQGSLIRFSTEQSVQILANGLNSNRIEASYSFFQPVTVWRQDNTEVLAFDIRGGTVLGDLAPYDAFPIGGSNSVRGFFEGEVGSGRSFATATAEYRFPIFNPVGGVVFMDYGTDLGSGAGVLGNPAAVRNKPGSGLGVGAGIRIQSPLGALRIDYGIRDFSADGGQITFGIGEKF
ncbi:MAG: BamA/TamA family outer membrane protein [Synechococcales cyanobacterium]